MYDKNHRDIFEKRITEAFQFEKGARDKLHKNHILLDPNGIFHVLLPPLLHLLIKANKGETERKRLQN